ncbi:MAG: hypothetical protein M1814_000091 [Vezdaea aestivalis]|nr:MAG: hypothetical protein M1814_000091 [Vezdaea aestivalis]
MAALTQGWNPGPNTRGTFDIIRTCIQTVILCGWTSICVNVPDLGNGRQFDLILDKFRFVMLTFLGPELVFLLAFGQYQSARASVKQFKASGFDDWTLTHAFYADMGGIRVRDKDWKKFPVNAKQLHYLVSHKYLTYPKIPMWEIKARAKVDGLARIITLGQTLYFLASTLSRPIQGLAMTTLELTVLGFIYCTLATNILWWKKPNDVEIGHDFDLNTGVREILLDVGDDAKDTYQDTPLDFVAREEWAIFTLWKFFVSILRLTGLFDDHQQERPIQRFTSFNFIKPQFQLSVLSIPWVGFSYLAIFFAGWHFHFPTWQERLLWRIFCVLQLGSSVVAVVLEGCFFHSFDIFARYDKRTGASLKSCFNEIKNDNGNGKRFGSSIHELWYMPINISIGRRTRLHIPLGSLVVATPLCGIYTLCRIFLIVEDFASLRSVDSSTYTAIEWARFWPFFKT